MEGKSRSEAQKIACLTINNFRIWLKRFNEQGIEGLRARKRPGRPCKLSDEVKKRLKEKVLKGPLVEEGLCRYRLIDLQSFLKETYGISVTLSGVWRQLHALDLTWRTGRQRHPKSDESAQEAFKKTFLIT